MRYLLGFLFTASPAILVIFPLQIVQEGLPDFPTKENLEPTKPGNWYHHYKNYFVETVKADVQFWAQGFMFLFWVTHILRSIF